MLTPSELRNAQFSKARLGGYVMSEVDKLLDEVTPDYEALYNENAELRKKVEVLLDRLDRYQEQEDSIKAAILNAQRMCDTIVAQARQQAALIEQDAKIKAGRVAEEAQRSIQDKRRAGLHPQGGHAVSQPACEPLPQPSGKNQGNPLL